MSSNEVVTEKKPYEPTPQEEAVIERVSKRRDSNGSAPDIRVTTSEETGNVSLGFDHEDIAVAQTLLMDEFGVSDCNFFAGLMKQMLSVGEPGQRVSGDAANFIASVIRTIKPQDEVETMLATQMAVVHQSTMLMARRLTHAETISQQDAAERAFNKLARTYTAQMQTLKKYRATAQQTVRVERVTVNDGGQAIVGNVEKGGGQHETKR